MSDSTFTWGTVTAIAPLRVKLDGDSAALASAPESLIDPLALAVNDRVRCELSNNRVIVHGHANDSRYLEARRNLVLNGNFRTNQLGYVSGDPMLQKWCFDRWYGSGRLNLVKNPSAAVNTTGWGATGGGSVSRITGQTIAGLAATTALRYTATAVVGGPWLLTATAPLLPVIPGRSYTFSAYVRSSVAKTVTANIEFQNGNNALVNAAQSAGVALTANTWTRISVTGVAGAGSAHAGPYVLPSAAWAAGNTLDVAGAMVEESASLNAYIDPMTLTFTTNVHGQAVTIPTGYTLAANLEQADVPAGDYVLSWEGTSLARVYNSGGSAPALAASPVKVTLDGLADVVIEAGAGTIGKVQLERGSVPTPFVDLPLALELLRCYRYYVRWLMTAVNQRVAGIGTMTSTVNDEFIAITPATMKSTPLVSFSLLWTSDGFSANGAITSLVIYFSVTPAISQNALSLQVTHVAYGAAGRPAVISAQAAGSWLEFRVDF